MDLVFRAAHSSSPSTSGEVVTALIGIWRGTGPWWRVDVIIIIIMNGGGGGGVNGRLVRWRRRKREYHQWIGEVMTQHPLLQSSHIFSSTFLETELQPQRWLQLPMLRTL